MFEDSLFASGMTPEKRRSAGRTRWIALTSVGVQGVVVAALVAVPLIWPERLPMVSVAPRVTLAALKKPEVKLQPKLVRVSADSTAISVPSSPQMLQTGPSRIASHAPAAASDDNLSPFTGTISMTGGSGIDTSLFGGSGNGNSGAPNVVAAAPKRSEPFKVSTGVAKGMLLSPIVPVYPRIAVSAHVEGTVVVTAVIDKQGRITGLQVLSGPELLRTAAIDAIRVARYHPFLLNGEATDVVTTISVNFRMGG